MHPGGVEVPSNCNQARCPSLALPCVSEQQEEVATAARPNSETPDEDGLKVLVGDGDRDRDWKSCGHLP